MIKILGKVKAADWSTAGYNPVENGPEAQREIRNILVEVHSCENRLDSLGQALTIGSLPSAARIADQVLESAQRMSREIKAAEKRFAK